MSYSQYLRLNLHVSDSDLQVIRQARRLILKKHRISPAMRSARHRFFSQMLTYHKQSRDLYVDVVRGDLTPETI